VPASDSAAAAHSLGEAYEVAARLGGGPGEALRHAARDSFVHGLHVTLLVSAVLLLLGAVMALRLPRVMDCGASAASLKDVPAPRETATPVRAESSV
jgi:DHA2 family multidrug resistance protein-like MFS transporter